MKRRNGMEYSDHETFSPWETYSDLYCGLLLVFVLLFFFAIYQYIDAKEKNIAETEALHETMLEEQASVLAMYKMDLEDQELEYQEKMKELESMRTALAIMQIDIEDRGTLLDEQQTIIDEQKQQLDMQLEQLAEQESLVESQKTELDEQKGLVESQKAELDEQKNVMIAQQALLTQQEKELETKQMIVDEQKLQLDEQSELLELQKTQLQDQQDLLNNQAIQIEQIVGVRGQLIDELNYELTLNEIQIQADKDTGSIAVESTILFAKDSNELSSEGKVFFEKFMPIYLGVLMKEEFKDYIAEIIIEGHTDTSGTYLHNLELSQKRALSVAEYFFSSNSTFLNEKQINNLKSLITVNGCADKSLIYREDGSVDEDSSRRVEIKFRLKDQEMIQEMDKILN